MFRVTLACLILVLVAVLDLPTASAAELPAHVRVLVPDAPYRKYLQTIQNANARVQSRVLGRPGKTSVTDPAFHFTLVLGVINAAADRLATANHRAPLLVYKETLDSELPHIYLHPANATNGLSLNLELINSGVKELKKLVQENCDNHDEKDCDKLVQYGLNKLGVYGQRATRVLVAAHELAREYLRLEIRLNLAANRLSGLGFVLRRPRRLSNVSQLFGHTLLEASRLYDDN